jgi:hypothetical protein
MTTQYQILPMTTAGVHHIIERTYREGGAFQWARETYINSIEADATRVEFGIEWQAVENLGVYRRVIADDGKGMNSEELVEFFNTFGGGGKPIGEAHENFGVGCKTSLLPWNKHGVAVISWENGYASMIWIQRDPNTGAYGLRLVEVEDDDGNVSLEPVYEPYRDDEHGCNWASVKPDWIKDHGTVIVLLGNDPNDDTVNGDPGRDESNTKGIALYLNSRLWRIQSKAEVYVDELRTDQRSDWPPSEAVGHGPQPAKGKDQRTNHRKIDGAHHFVNFPQRRFMGRTQPDGSRLPGGKVAAQGTVTIDGGVGHLVAIDWFLWSGARPVVHAYAPEDGFIATLYQNELYDVTSHLATYRSFGITEKAVRENLWLIIKPDILGRDGKYGVYPKTDRNSLLLRGGPHAGGALPINDWGMQFSERMPQAIQDAINACRAGQTGTIQDAKWRDRLLERFGTRWNILKLGVHKSGAQTVLPVQPGSTPRAIRRARPPAPPHPPRPAPTLRGLAGPNTIGTVAGPNPARQTQLRGDIPDFLVVTADDLGASAEYMACWLPYPQSGAQYPAGLVKINCEHLVLVEMVQHWQDQYPAHMADQVSKYVLDIYGQIAAAKIAHSERFRSGLLMASKTVDDELRSPAALTMALLGLIAEEAVIAPGLGGALGKLRRQATP